MGSSKSTSTSKTTAYKPVEPILEGGSRIMLDHMNNPNSTAVYDGPRVAEFSDATNTGLQELQDSRGANEASNYYRGIMNSEAGANNPQVAAMQDMLRRQAQSASNAQFSRSGTSGGTAHQGIFAQGFTDAMARPLFDQYNQDMNRQMSAAGNLVNSDQRSIDNQIAAGGMIDSRRQNELNADQQEFEERRTAPLRGWMDVAPLANDMGSRFGTQRTTQRTSQPIGNMIAGGLMAGAGAMSGNPMALGGLFGQGGGGGGNPWGYQPIGGPGYALGPNGPVRR